MNVGKNRLLLIEPPFHVLFSETYSLDRYPLSLGYLSAVVARDTDWEVKTYCADFTKDSARPSIAYLTGEGFTNYRKSLENPDAPAWHRIRDMVAAQAPSVVGISTKSQNYAAVRRVARICKSLDKDMVVVLGGPHPSMVGAQVLECEHIDIAVRGEAEVTIVELLSALSSGADLRSVRGIVFRSETGPVETEPRELIADLDVLPFPHVAAPEILINYDAFPRSAFRSIFAVRGCPHRCRFCGSHKIWGRRPRSRSPRNVVAEIRAMQDMGVTVFRFDDDTFGITAQGIRDLCTHLIEHCPGLQWSCELHIRLVTDENLAIMKRAGCYSIQIGVESGNNDILEGIGKAATIEDAMRAANLIRKHDMELHAFFMVGLPDETEETLQDTIRAMQQMHSCDILYSIFNPYPGTDIFDECRQRGLIDDTYDIALHNHQSPESCFCAAIPHERFRAIVADIERLIDQRNRAYQRRRLFSGHTLRRIRQAGLRNALKRGIRLTLGN